MPDDADGPITEPLIPIREETGLPPPPNSEVRLVLVVEEDAVGEHETQPG